MTARFQWDEITTGSNWVASKDWYKFVIDLPMAHGVGAPGDVCNCNTVSITYGQVQAPIA